MEPSCLNLLVYTVGGMGFIPECLLMMMMCLNGPWATCIHGSWPLMGYVHWRSPESPTCHATARPPSPSRPSRLPCCRPPASTCCPTERHGAPTACSPADQGTSSRAGEGHRAGPKAGHPRPPRAPEEACCPWPTGARKGARARPSSRQPHAALGSLRRASD